MCLILNWLFIIGFPQFYLFNPVKFGCIALITLYSPVVKLNKSAYIFLMSVLSDYGNVSLNSSLGAISTIASSLDKMLLQNVLSA